VIAANLLPWATRPEVRTCAIKAFNCWPRLWVDEESLLELGHCGRPFLLVAEYLTQSKIRIDGIDVGLDSKFESALCVDRPTSSEVGLPKKDQALGEVRIGLDGTFKMGDGSVDLTGVSLKLPESKMGERMHWHDENRRLKSGPGTIGNACRDPIQSLLVTHMKSPPTIAIGSLVPFRQFVDLG